MPGGRYPVTTSSVRVVSLHGSQVTGACYTVRYFGLKTPGARSIRAVASLSTWDSILGCARESLAEKIPRNPESNNEMAAKRSKTVSMLFGPE